MRLSGVHGGAEKGRGRLGESASILIIVLWVSFGLVTLALYFANSMSLELRATDNMTAGLEAEKAIEGAARYVSNLLATAAMPGVLPETNLYYSASVPVGEALFWMIGRGDGQGPPSAIYFGLVDESSKLNLNTATRAMMEWLPRVTPELIGGIIDWRDANETASENGAESDIYQRLNPPYRSKNANFETVGELRLVSGAVLDLLFGEDANLNGVLDANENDGAVSPPWDNMNGELDAGLLDFFTVYSSEPLTDTNGATRIDVSAANMRQQLAPVLAAALGNERGNAILRQLPGGTGGGGRGGQGGQGGAAAGLGSVLELYIRGGMTPMEFALIEDQVRNAATNGLVNVNTASEDVLACVPGIGIDYARTLVSSRGSRPRPLTSVAWVKDVLPESNALQAGPYLTGKGYQVAADIAAVGRFGRGYRRVRFVFDTRSGAPRIVHRQDLTHLGWALGRQILETQQTFSRNFR